MTTPRTPRWFVPSVLVLLGGAATAGESLLEVRLEGIARRIQAGEVLQPVLVLRNDGDGPYYVIRPTSVGPASVELVARRDVCESSASRVHFDQPLAALRFRYVPLLPGDEFRIPLPAFNEIGSGLVFPMPFSGEYSVVARVSSDGPLAEGLVWPIWRGATVSAPVKVEVEGPAERKKEEWLQMLGSCFDATECDVLTAVQPFEVTHIAGAAPLLRALLSADPAGNLIALNALMLQGDSSDVDFLGALARRVDLDERSRETFAEARESLLKRKGDTCWPSHM